MNYKQRLWTKLNSTKQLWWAKHWTRQNENDSDDDHKLKWNVLWAKSLQNDVPMSTETSPQPEMSQNTMRPSIPSTSKSIYWRLGGGENACVECVGRGLVVTLGPAKLTNPESIKSCIAWWSANNAQYHIPESDDTSNAHESENVEE